MPAVPCRGSAIARWIGIAAALPVLLLALPQVASAQVTDSIPDDIRQLFGDSLPGNLTPDQVQELLGDSAAVGAAQGGIAALPGDTIPGDSIGAASEDLSASAEAVLQALRALPGYTTTEYRGDRAVYTTENGLLRLEGAAEVRRADEQLTADTIIYRDQQDLVEAFGSPRVSGNNQELQGRELYYDLNRRRATALGARTEIQQDATWFVTGDMTAEGTSRLFGSHAQFTSCDLAIPHYHFEADEVMVIRDKIIVARPARLYFGDVPVMVLPFVVQNLEQGRRSGLLTPRFGLNDIVRTSSGYNRQISDLGFYWAVNEYLGAQLSGTWRSGAYTALLGNVDFNWRRQFLRGRFGAEHYWRTDRGQRELGVNAQSSWRPDERTNLNLSGRFATSTSFIRESSYDPREVTQDLRSSLSINRSFDWGSVGFGADRSQSIASGDVSMRLPTLSISRNPITLLRSSESGPGSWLGDVIFSPGSFTASRSTNDYDLNTAGRQDRDETRASLGPSLTVGNFTFSSSADLNRTELAEATDENEFGEIVVVAPSLRDVANLSGSASYRQQLIGSTNLTPTVSINQTIVKDSLTADGYVSAPARINFGTGLNTDLYGFFPGVGGYSAIRHRFSPQIRYGYAPEVQQTALQEQVFGPAGGRAQNRVSLSLTQTFEAKLRTPRVEEEEPVVAADSIAGDSVAVVQTQQRMPTEPDKVTILSINTSAFEYDFVQAREEGNGFVTRNVSNTISSDYMNGLSVQMQHELFDRRELDPGLPENSGKLGRFAPRLSSLSTSFELGPQSSIFRWLDRFGIGTGNVESPEEAGVLPGPVGNDEPTADGQGSFTGNPRGMGGGPWRASFRYQYSRQPRSFVTNPGLIDDEAVQTLDGSMSFALSPNWAVSWNTSYSLTDGEFGAHRLNFQRDLHEWQANFNFYQTPNGNAAFEFYVELSQNRDLRFDYAERNLIIDRN